MQFQPSETLKSRTYLGLILAQFLAAFNDQAIHMVAIFYAGDLLVRYVGHLGNWRIDEKAVISLVTACFITPFFLFSPLAGMLADKYSKRNILVLWKLAEVAMMAIALVGFLLPHLGVAGLAEPETLAQWSALLVVSVVFLMGTHSAFFVPAKYGIMPEILHPVVLSKGNGFLEGSSFVAQTIGTAAGGLLYYEWKSEVQHLPDGSVLVPGKEWLIGLLLFALALMGAAASFLIARVRPAAAELPLTWKLWQPLRANLRVLLRSRPLVLALLGIAFFTYITLFARQALIYDGETDKEIQSVAAQAEKDHLEQLGIPLPGATATQKAELKIALLIALVGLGIGIGSPLAGVLSGSKVELGLVPIGAVFLIAFTGAMAVLINWMWTTIACLILIGVAAGFYIVPLYTLLQHRAPKESKGNLVATSNFINVAGGLLAVAAFFIVTGSLERLLRVNVAKKGMEELQLQLQIPRILFVTLSLMIAGMLVLLCRKLPDFFVRSLLWLRSHSRYRLKVIGLHNLLSEGPVILATNCDHFESCMQVVTATDRFTRFILFESDVEEKPPWLLRYLARRTGLVALPARGAKPDAWDKALRKAAKSLAEGHLLGVTADGAASSAEMAKFMSDLRSLCPAPILPVYCGSVSLHSIPDGHSSLIRRVQVVIGHALPANVTEAEIRQAIHQLGEEVQQAHPVALNPASAMTPAAASVSPSTTGSDRPLLP
jgi:acyl-[acyl-carrier-protein]-phospholipid O-acyltransferase/long-chain-fatty-acid--[acyl-carrier-protein] ligase